jgi:hypothetical protein
MIPPISEFPRHPFQYIGVCIDVLRMHEEHESALTAEKRRRKIEDVSKRNEYRKAHGMEPATGFFGGTTVTAPGKEEQEEKVGDDVAVPIVPATGVPPPPTPGMEAEFTPEGKRKKFLGIF